MRPMQIRPTLEDFKRTSWEEALRDSSQRESFAYSQVFFARASRADATGTTNERDVYLLLAHVASMALDLEDHQHSLRSRTTALATRSASTDDFTDENIDVLRELAPSILDPEMRARIADVVWIRRRDRNAGELAVDAYLDSAKVLEDPETWVLPVQRIERALQIAASLGKNGVYFQRVVTYVQRILDKFQGGDPLFFSERLMFLLQEHKLGDARRYARFAESAAKRAEQDKKWHIAVAYWECKSRWHTLDQNDVEKRNALIAAAEVHRMQADDMLAQAVPDYSSAAMSLKTAIQYYRQRVGGMRERIEELHRRLLTVERQSTTQFYPFSQSVDATEIANKAIDHVKGKPLLDAITRLGMIRRPTRCDALRQRVIEATKKYPLQFLFASVSVNEAGRTVAVRESLRQDDPDEYERALRGEMFAQAAFDHNMNVQAVIEPARAQINSEHAPRLNDILPLMMNSYLVPSGREVIFARGIYYGLIGDYMLAAHLLVFQLEYAIRFLVEQKGGTTSKLDDSGIQEDFDLGRVFREHRILLESVLGDDLTFDLQGLLVEKLGSNLRNVLAHGLVSDDGFNTVPMSYLWWLSLHYCVFGLLLVERASRGEEVIAADVPGNADGEVGVTRPTDGS